MSAIHPTLVQVVCLIVLVVASAHILFCCWQYEVRLYSCLAEQGILRGRRCSHPSAHGIGMSNNVWYALSHDLSALAWCCFAWELKWHAGNFGAAPPCPGVRSRGCCPHVHQLPGLTCCSPVLAPTSLCHSHLVVLVVYQRKVVHACVHACVRLMAQLRRHRS